MSEFNPLVLAGLPLNELERILEELRHGNKAAGHIQKVMAARYELVHEAIRVAKTPPESLVISDHALIRWLERVEKMDLEPYREKMRAMTAGKVNPYCDHDVVVSEELDAALIIRGKDRAGRGSDNIVVTVLNVAGHELPTAGQLKVEKD